MFRTAIVLCLSATTVQAASYSGTETWDVTSPSINGSSFGTITVTHTYEGSPETGYRATGGSYTTNFLELVTTYTGRVRIEPAQFPNPSVFETRTVTQTLEIIQWPAFVGPATTSDVFYGDGEWFFNTHIVASGQSIVRRTLEGPLTTTVEDIYLAGWTPRHTARTVVNLDGGLAPDGWMNRISVGTASTGHDGVFITSTFFESGAPLVPTPEPLGSVMIALSIPLCTWKLRRRISKAIR